MSSKILINEFFPDPVGPDKGWEWIEIVNISNEEIDLSNWEIQVGGTNYNRAFKFPEGSKILPEEYILICENFVENCNYYTSTLAMQNGIGKTDGLRILNNSGEIINTVLYSKPNRNELKNDFGDIEKDENIVEKTGEGFSFSRKNFSNTGFSVQDFFTTTKPTPGKENIFHGTIVISEVGIDFIEFYSAKLPEDLSSWYFKKSLEENEKTFLQNSSKNNFFFLKTTQPLKNLFLFSPDDILIDSFATKNLSPNYTYCRPNSVLDEEFQFCEKTIGEKNELKNWKPLSLFETINIGEKDSSVVEFCTMYEYGNIFVISDNTAALGLNCEDCESEKCYLGEISSLENLYILEERELGEIKIEFAKKENHTDLFNKLILLEGEVSKTNNGFSYITTDIGLVKIDGNEYLSKNKYTFKGILLKEENASLALKYPIIVSKKPTEQLLELEQTGDPLIFLLFFFILPFLLSKIFVKLATVSFK